MTSKRVVEIVDPGLTIEFLIRRGCLAPHSRVLDLNCSNGLAPILSTYLVSGTYDGADKYQSQVVKSRASCRFRRDFHFRQIDMSKEWQYDAGSYDLVICVGPMRHLRFAGVAAVIARSAAVLRYDGNLCCTARLLNHHSMAHIGKRYSHRTSDLWYSSTSKPLSDVALPEEGFRRAMLRARLQIREPIGYGKWAMVDGPFMSDMVVARKL